MGDGGRQYSCTFCGRAFVRNEHLIRHRRIRKSPHGPLPVLADFLIDTLEKPFACGYCPQRFSRSDQFRRHVLSSHADLPLHDARLSGNPPTDKQERVKIACDHCNKAKVKCVKGIPCSSCVSKRLECRISENRLAASRGRSLSTSVGSLGDLPNSHTSRPFQQSNTDLSSRADDTTIITNAEAATGQSRIGDDDDDDALNRASAFTAPAPMVNDFEVSAIFNAVDGTEIQEGTRTTYDSLFEFDDFLSLEHIDVEFPVLGSDFNFELDWVGQPSNGDPIQLDTSVTEGQTSSETFRRFRHFSDLDTSRAQSPASSSARPHFASAPATEDPTSTGVDNRAVLDVFITLFEINAAPWLDAITDEIFITSKTPPEWFLAIAALGGLFCNTPGAGTIARWLYNNSRYKLLAFVCCFMVPLRQTDCSKVNTSSFSLASTRDKKIALETVTIPSTIFQRPLTVDKSIVLSVFGYLAGDKRIFELTEVHHAKLIEVRVTLHNCVLSSLTS
ncbi:uncharacterized protein A1O9_03964 [Exophiala aquamarina CBS 119918]|uniref:Zn(2)-C6 fungal-type domain-containing protein n=1 Tax=Exophiala aquamarina CBS 119918 TaxID=1182545 RepID=A0A072PUA3_9EURO|nr:uncharacterized protein A1O9_03964 [Exophiala aquamarina CBS 119918]KEF59120.1 hypothetical protein A1O9_03964 [Exophiala aquamarina CBS 119918]